MNNEQMDITLLISIHESPILLKRTLEYYKDFPCRKILVDSSKEALINGVLPEGFEYSHHPGSFLECKLSQVVNKVTTKYCLITDHDDFYVMDGIKKCIIHLDAHPEDSCASGQYVRYKFYNKIPRFALKYAWAYLPLMNRSRQADPIARLEKSHKPSFAPINAVHRTENVINFYKHFKEHYYYVSLIDRSSAMLYALWGNVVFLPVFYCARNEGDSMVNPEFSNRLTAPQVLTSKDERAVKASETFIQMITSEMQKSDPQITSGRCRKIIISVVCDSQSAEKKSAFYMILVVIKEKLLRIFLGRFSVFSDIYEYFDDFIDTHCGFSFFNKRKDLPVFSSLDEIKKIRNIIDEIQ